jgi:hypothetical protein
MNRSPWRQRPWARAYPFLGKWQPPDSPESYRGRRPRRGRGRVTRICEAARGSASGEASCLAGVTASSRSGARLVRHGRTEQSAVVDRGVWVLVVAGPVAREHWAAPLTGPPARGPVCDRSCAILIVDLFRPVISDACHALIVILNTIRSYSCNDSLELGETPRQREQASSSGSNSDLVARQL